MRATRSFIIVISITVYTYNYLQNDVDRFFPSPLVTFLNQFQYYKPNVEYKNGNKYIIHDK